MPASNTHSMYTMTPTVHISVEKPTALPLTSSGEEYSDDPVTTFTLSSGSSLVAMAKSMMRILLLFLVSYIILWGCESIIKMTGY